MQHGINNTKIKNCSYQENVHSIIVKILQMSELSIIHAACQVCLHYVVHYSTMDFFFFFFIIKKAVISWSYFLMQKCSKKVPFTP